ncbi:MAG: hypothetical protein C5B54_10215 [Acidobacteria bacterium]|nr:MAG: hypothetical protein C5B54_10215 [Acidobacteriota bacterium]
MNNQLATTSGFNFATAMEHSTAISKSTIIPREFQGNPANCLIALELAYRIGAGVLATMQSLYIVHGKPSWSGQFIIGAINQTKRFSQLRFAFNGDKSECFAFAVDRDGNELKGPTVSIAMAKAEGWYANNKKWQTMTELMLMYRSGTFFGRVFCPDVLLGMKEEYEVIEADVTEIKDAKIPQTTKDILHDAAVGDGGEQQPETAPAAEPTPPKRTPKKKLQIKEKEVPLSEKKVALKDILTTKPDGLQEMAEKQPNRVALLARLQVGGYNEADFLKVANKNEWLGKGRTWDSLDQLNNDDMLALFLDPEEWETVQNQLEKSK